VLGGLAAYATWKGGEANHAEYERKLAAAHGEPAAK
jgi:hypothetical protein